MHMNTDKQFKEMRDTMHYMNEIQQIEIIKRLYQNWYSRKLQSIEKKYS